MPKISVIVPVYNVEKYLPQCLDSILAQTFTDFELILVNDGSKDRSGNICDEYAQKDSRIVVIHKENGGASSARNSGLDIAKGEWISFIDSDDYVTPNYLSDLISEAQANCASLVIQGHIYQKKGSETSATLTISKVFQLPEQADLIWQNLNVFKYCGPYGKIFSNKTIKAHNVRYSQGMIIAEDYDFLLKYIKHCNRIYLSQTVNYVYCGHDGSTCTKIYSPEIELFGLIQADSSYISLFSRVGEKSSILNQYHLFVAYITHRVIISVYLSTDDRKTRLTYIKSIPDKFRTIYSKHFSASTIFLKAVKLLFSHKCFNTLDFILALRFKLLHD